jgi:soluble lytic murein transglycosylase-like protein
MDNENNGEKNRKPGTYVPWVLAVFFLLISLGLVYLMITMSKSLNNEIISIKKTQDEQFIKHTETNQFLLSTIDWSSRRSQMILFMRDQIVSQWRKNAIKVNVAEAYLIAEAIMRECDNYTYIDPFLILATQCVESRFIKDIRSPMGAVGLNQIMPATGRLMAGYFGIAYRDSLLLSVPISTRFAVKLFDILYAQYQSWDLVLAGYNGGPWQAHYYKTKKESLAAETKQYVPDVLRRKKEYDSLFLKYKIEESVIGENNTEKLACR